MRKSTKTREKRRWKTKRVVSLSRSTMEGWECKKKLWRAFYGSDLFTERTLGFLKWSLCSRSAQSARARQGRLTDNCDPQTTCHTNYYRHRAYVRGQCMLEQHVSSCIIVSTFPWALSKNIGKFTGYLGPREKIGHSVWVSICYHIHTAKEDIVWLPLLEIFAVITTIPRLFTDDVVRDIVYWITRSKIEAFRCFLILRQGREFSAEKGFSAEGKPILFVLVYMILRNQINNLSFSCKGIES